MKQISKFVVREASITGEIRRTVANWSKELNLDETLSGKISIVITEMTSNILKHAGSGEVIAVLTENSIELLAIDKGPGMANPSECFKDGFSTQGTQGTGLGAIKRLSTRFDLYTQLGKGTVVYSQFKSEEAQQNKSIYDIGGISIPYKDEPVCGDGWTHVEENGVVKILVSDGLGHGIFANEASRQAADTFHLSSHSSPLDDINRLHNAMRSTRGAAVAIAYVDFKNQKIDYAGLGNISSTIFSEKSAKRLISYNGIVGIQMRKVQPMTYPMDSRSVFILFSDGLSSHWNLNDYPGLQFKPAYLIAGFIYRDFGRTTDDVTVVVMKEIE